MGKNFLKQLGNGFKKTGNWFKHAGEDTFHWGEKTVSSVGNKILNFADKQTSKLTNVFSSPTFLIVAGAVVVVFIMMKR